MESVDLGRAIEVVDEPDRLREPQAAIQKQVSQAPVLQGRVGELSQGSLDFAFRGDVQVAAGNFFGDSLPERVQVVDVGALELGEVEEVPHRAVKVVLLPRRQPGEDPDDVRF